MNDPLSTARYKRIARHWHSDPENRPWHGMDKVRKVLNRLDIKMDVSGPEQCVNRLGWMFRATAFLGMMDIEILDRRAFTRSFEKLFNGLKANIAAQMARHVGKGYGGFTP